MKTIEFDDVSWGIIAAALAASPVSDIVLYLSAGTGPGGAIRRPMWSALALAGCAAFGATKSRGAERWFFLIWVMMQVLVVATPVGYSGWAPWVIRSSLIVTSAALLIVAHVPFSSRARGIAAGAFVVAVALFSLVKWWGLHVYLKHQQA